MVSYHENVMKRNTRWNTDLAVRLRDARVAAGLTQCQAARLLECSQAFISMMESGDRMPDAPVIARCCDIYAVDGNWILGLTDESNIDPDWIEKIKALPPADRVKMRKMLAMMGA